MSKYKPMTLEEFQSKLLDMGFTNQEVEMGFHIFEHEGLVKKQILNNQIYYQFTEKADKLEKRQVD